MFSLVAFHNERCSVVPTKQIKNGHNKRMCIVKCNGGNYSAFLIKKSDDKSFLQELKKQKEASYKESSSIKQPFGDNLSSTADTGPDNYLLETEDQRESKSFQYTTQRDLINIKNDAKNKPERKILTNAQSSSQVENSPFENCFKNNFTKPIASMFENEIENPTNTYAINTSKQEIVVTSVANSPQSTPLDLTNPKTFEIKNNMIIKPTNLAFPSAVGIRKRALSFDSSSKEDVDVEKLKATFKGRKQSSTYNRLSQSSNGKSPVVENRHTVATNDSVERIESADTEDDPSTSRKDCSFSVPKTSIEANHNSTILSEMHTSHENVTDLSSVNMRDSTISEYIMDSVDMSRSFDNSRNLSEKNRSVDVIETPIDVTKVIVPESKREYKKHFCIFCHKLQCKISRHIFLKHKKDPLVKKALLMPVKSKERLKIIADLRKRGDFLHNTSPEFNSGILIVPRRQQKKAKNLADDYICCKNCKGFFSKRTLRIHISKCTGTKNSRTNLIEGRRLTQYIHPVSNEVLKCKVFPTLRNDCITKAIRYDELIIKFGNKLTEKYSAQHQHDMIRANLRLLGRFKMEFIKLEPDVKELKNILKPQHFDKCIKAVRATANWDDKIMGFKTPAVAQSITSLIKKCAKKQRAELIKEQNEEIKTELENFLLLWEEETPTLINKKALEDQTNKKREKKVIMPAKDDIKKIYLHMKALINKSMKTLIGGFCMSAWSDLVKATLILNQIFNRRRAGEIERMTIDNFRNQEVIKENVNENEKQKLSDESIKFARQFVRIYIRGKLGRTVPVLLCPLSINAIEIILRHRSEAGITEENRYIFSRPTTSKLAKQYYRACPLLKKFAEECGAQIPESLRGTSLRKQIATYTASLNVEEASVDRLANFMGHHKDIHKNIYRVSVPVAEIACVSKMLMDAISNEEDLEANNNVTDDDDEDEDEDETEIENRNMEKEPNSSILKEHLYSHDSFEDSEGNSPLLGKKRRSTSPFGKTKRVRWSDVEKAAIFSAFGNICDMESLPTLKKCLQVISEYPALKQRTPQQVKSWIDNQRRYKTDL